MEVEKYIFTLIIFYGIIIIRNKRGIMKISVKVPATTANFGSGFDCIGMALPIYNIVTIEETVLPGTGVEINIISETDDDDEFAIEHIPKDENNIIYKAVEMLYNLIGQSPSELKNQYKITNTYS